MHPRYYSFYAFLLDEFWRRDFARSQRSWVQFFRPRDLAYCLACLSCGADEHGDLRGIVGGQNAGPLVNSARTEFDTAFNYMDSPLGGYGLYYRSVMAELGVIYPGGPGFPVPVDVPTEEGQRLAASFRGAVGSTAYYQDYFDADAPIVPRSVIEEYAARACLCQLQTADAPDRPQMIDRYLHAGIDADARRATFRMLLDVADQSETIPVDQSAFRQRVYFGACADGCRYQPGPGVALTFRRWRFYQTREYYAFALNALWRHLCDWGLHQRGDLRPVPMTTFWDHLRATLDFASLASRFDLADPGIGPDTPFTTLLDWLSAAAEIDPKHPAEPGAVGAPIHEHRLYQMEMAPDERPTVPAMLAMLALVFRRFSDPSVACTSTRTRRPRPCLTAWVRAVPVASRRMLQPGRTPLGTGSRWAFWTASS